MARERKNKDAETGKKAASGSGEDKFAKRLRERAAEPGASSTSTDELSPRERGSQRRREFDALKTKMAAEGSGDPVIEWLNSTQETEVRAFVASRSAIMKQREYQISLVKDFIGDPSRFGIDPGEIPTSTSLDEFASRKGELQYLITTVRTFLELLTDEMKVLEQAEAHARKSDAGGEK